MSTDPNAKPGLIPVKDWLPWIKSDHIVGHPAPLYRRDLTPSQRTDFDQQMLARKEAAEKKVKPRRRPRNRKPKDQQDQQPPEQKP